MCYNKSVDKIKSTGRASLRVFVKLEGWLLLPLTGDNLILLKSLTLKTPPL